MCFLAVGLSWNCQSKSQKSNITGLENVCQRIVFWGQLEISYFPEAVVINVEVASRMGGFWSLHSVAGWRSGFFLYFFGALHHFCTNDFAICAYGFWNTFPESVRLHSSPASGTWSAGLHSNFHASHHRDDVACSYGDVWCFESLCPFRLLGDCRSWPNTRRDLF